MSDAHAATNAVKIYTAIFIALIVGTVATVSATYMNTGHWGNILIAIAIAATKASLVALFFMHLKWEKRLLWGIALFPLLLFTILLGALMPDCVLRHRGEHALPPPPVEHHESQPH